MILRSATNVGPIVDAVAEHTVASQVLLYAFTNRLEDTALVQESLQNLLPILCSKMDCSDRGPRETFLSFLGELLTRIPSEVNKYVSIDSFHHLLTSSVFPPDPAWVESVYATIRSIITPGPSPGERRSSFIVIAGLLNAYPPELLFRPQPLEKGSSASKPFVYLLIQLAKIDVRSAFPAILEQLASPSYPATAQRLAAAFDIVVSFLAFLVRAEDFASIGMEPDPLLQLRNDIGEMFGLTLEFLRDRWDAA